MDLDAMDYPAVEIGKGEILRRGSRVALLGIGHMTMSFLEAADLLEKELGHPVTVADARFVKPLDRDMIVALAAEHEFLFTCEDNTIRGGFGSAVNELLAEEKSPRLAAVFGLPDAFVDHGTPKQLYRDVGLMPDQLAKRVLVGMRDKG